MQVHRDSEIPECPLFLPEFTIPVENFRQVFCIPVHVIPVSISLFSGKNVTYLLVTCSHSGSSQNFNPICLQGCDRVAIASRQTTQYYQSPLKSVMSQLSFAGSPTNRFSPLQEPDAATTAEMEVEQSFESILSADERGSANSAEAETQHSNNQ